MITTEVKEDKTVGSRFVTFEAQIDGKSLQSCKLHSNKLNDFKTELFNLYAKFNVIPDKTDDIKEDDLFAESKLLSTNLDSTVMKKSNSEEEDLSNLTNAEYIERKTRVTSIYPLQLSNEVKKNRKKVFDDTKNNEQEILIWDQLSSKMKQIIQKPVMYDHSLPSFFSS